MFIPPALPGQPDPLGPDHGAKALVVWYSIVTPILVALLAILVYPGFW